MSNTNNETVKTAANPNAITCIVTGCNALNIRKTTSLNGEFDATSPVNAGDELMAYPGTEVEAEGYTWIKVKGKGKNCWAVKAYLTPVKNIEEGETDG